LLCFIFLKLPAEGADMFFTWVCTILFHENYQSHKLINVPLQQFGRSVSKYWSSTQEVENSANMTQDCWTFLDKNLFSYVRPLPGEGVSIHIGFSLWMEKLSQWESRKEPLQNL
uniref:Uncharacterized protein n=1 Tax=Poecilia mexicana TaxID=48701 RepID=A0A3B3X7W8_9TELE